MPEQYLNFATATSGAKNPTWNSWQNLDLLLPFHKSE